VGGSLPVGGPLLPEEHWANDDEHDEHEQNIDCWESTEDQSQLKVDETQASQVSAWLGETHVRVNVDDCPDSIATIEGPVDELYVLIEVIQVSVSKSDVGLNSEEEDWSNNQSHKLLEHVVGIHMAHFSLWFSLLIELEDWSTVDCGWYDLVCTLENVGRPSEVDHGTQQVEDVEPVISV